MLSFLLNRREVTLQDFAADTTVLDYLRNVEGKCGTKEGCASGDCGACTVVVAEPSKNGIEYSSINSCITFLGAVHGKQIITVEDLTEEDSLHPVQQAMVDSHGSQCGFCTPGFVMSMFALYKNIGPDVDLDHRHRAVHEFLGGNLCRCTGYRPIIDAAMASTEMVKPDQFSRDEKTVAENLSKIKNREVSEPDKNAGSFLIPQTLSSLASIYVDNPGARLLAGGTDLALEVTQQLGTLDHIIYVCQVPELLRVERIENSLEIGAAVSLARFEQAVEEWYPQISELLKRFGSVQIRNQGTVGGNIANASPIGDLPPVMIALNADITLQKGDNTRTVALDDFFIDYRRTLLGEGEFVSTISMPLPTPKQLFRIYKVSKRLDDDISAVCMAINVEVEEFLSEGTMQITSARIASVRIASVRIALGGLAAVPKRALHCESVLQNSILNDSTMRKAAAALEKDFSPISDARASAEYRIQVAKNLLQRFHLEILGDEIKTRVEHAA